MDDIFLTIVEHIPFILMVFISLPIHEVAHGLVANWLGDDTAYYQGRLTLNPFAHLDLFGTISMVLFGYGWAKPVPVNPRRFKCNMRLGMALTALAGPVSNLILALLCTILLKSSNLIGDVSGQEFFYFLGWVFASMCIANIGLAFFNLLPIPPLDGSRILNYFLPYRAQQFMDRLENYSMYIIIGLLIVSDRTDLFGIILSYPMQGIVWLFDKLTFFMGDMWYYPLYYFLQ